MSGKSNTPKNAEFAAWRNTGGGNGKDKRRSREDKPLDRVKPPTEKKRCRELTR